MQNNTELYDIEVEANEDLPRMKELLKNSCFGSTNVWVDKIYYGPKNIPMWTIKFTY